MLIHVSSHEKLLDPTGVNILPYVLLPLMGNEEYELEDTEGMLDECQLLPPDKEREKQSDIICIHLESLLLLSDDVLGFLAGGSNSSSDSLSQSLVACARVEWIRNLCRARSAPSSSRRR